MNRDRIQPRAQRIFYLYNRGSPRARNTWNELVRTVRNANIAPAVCGLETEIQPHTKEYDSQPIASILDHHNCNRVYFEIFSRDLQEIHFTPTPPAVKGHLRWPSWSQHPLPTLPADSLEYDASSSPVPTQGLQ
jgi:hypothetical protein